MTKKHNKEDYVILETINGTLETVHKSELTQVMTHYKGLRIDCLPDLLEALEMALECFDGFGIREDPEYFEVRSKARAAIAKARGE